MSTVIEVNHLVKKYGDLIAVNDISFTVPAGSCLGILGPNGAGKTTTIEIMEGIIEASSGDIRYYNEQSLLGHDNKRLSHSVDASVSQKIGILFQHTALQDFLTVQETLNLFTSFYDHTLPHETLIEMCNLQEFLHQDNRLLSGGQRQRLLLALALINDPQIVFLDEPTTGLDPQARRNFWQLIKKIKAENKTIILTTHYMDEAEQLCDDLVIIDHGKVVAQGAPNTLLHEHFPQTFIDLPLTDISEEQIDKILKMKGKINGDLVELITEDVAKTFNDLLSLNLSLQNIHVKSANLDDLFLKLTGHSLRE